MAEQQGSGPDSSGLGKKGGGPTKASAPPTIRFADPPAKPSDSTKSDSIDFDSRRRPEYERSVNSNDSSSSLADLRAHHANLPVTPGIGTRTYSPSPDPIRSHHDATGSPDYFQSRPSNEAAISPDPLDDNMAANAPEGSDAAAMSGHDILRRMSKSSQNRRESIHDIRSAYPSLHLSGNVISATFNMPHSLRYRKGADWELKSRRGQSALFDGLAHLSSEASSWNHTTVAWTGEIDAPSDFPSPPETPPLTTAHLPGLNKLSAPIPVDTTEKPLPTPPARDGLWIPKEDMDRLDYQLSHDKKIKTVPVWLADDVENQEEGILLKDQSRWRRYAEHDLYTLFHYKTPVPSDGRKERAQWADYYRMNQKFANKILELYKPGDIVLIHDYYLMLLPSMLRQRVPHMYISFFLHCPFPSSEFLRCLPRRKEILEGVLGSNLIGFQSYSYSRHFSSCCTRICSYPSDTGGVETFGSRVEVGVYPIGIDAKKVESMAFCPEVDAKVKALKKMYAGKKLIVGRDRLDSVRGVAQKLMAFDRFLELYPDWREKVVLIQVTSPTSTTEDEKEDPENKIASRVNEWVSRIHGTYGHLGYDPVQHFPQYLSQDEYFALLRAADIGLITSVRDGMNTTSLEYIVCQRENNGPLILSEFSGTAGSLKDAIHINPWDLSGVADELNNALTMPAEKRYAMQKSLHDHVTSKNVQHWINSLLSRLVNVLGNSTKIVSTPLLDRALMLQTYRSAKKRLFMFDYDGTLTPIVKEPSAAIPSHRVITTLTTLAADHRNAVWIISGRDQAFLAQHLGHIKELGFSAEHGSFMRHPGSQEWENLAETFDMGWQSEVMEVFQTYTDKCPGSFIERKRCALTWHYRLADPEQGPHLAQECQTELEATVARRWDVDVMPGKANIEVRPTFINKGEIAKRLVATYNSDMSHVPGSAASSTNPDKDAKLEFVLCLGDDFTDEDMFRALNGMSAPPDKGEEERNLDPEHVFSVTVGASTKVTLARWHLLEPEDVVDCVALLAGVGGGGTSASAGGALSMGEVNLAALSSVEGHLPASLE